MNASRLLSFAASLLCVATLTAMAPGQAAITVAQKQLLEFSADGVKQRVTPADQSKKQVTVANAQAPAAPGLDVSIEPGKAGFPGIEIKPNGADAWDLSAFGHVEARVVNTSAAAVELALRVDNEGDWQSEPWSAETIKLQPGAAGTISVIFGYSFGHRPSYALKPSAIVSFQLYARKSDAVQSFRIESLIAAGPAGEKPPIDPQLIRIKPQGGVILGAGVKLEPTSQLENAGGAQASAAAGAGDAAALRIEFPAGAGEQSASLKPTAGRWDLTDATEVRVKVKNVGQASITPQVQVMSNAGPTDRAAAGPLAPGASSEIVVPFAAAVPFVGVKTIHPGHQGGLPGTGTHFTSDAVSAIAFTTRHDGAAALLVESIIADAPAAVVPDWLGKRPPVPGEWAKTLDDDFSAPAIDQSVWNIYGPNYWDKKTHWSKDNLVLNGHGITLHFENKPGHQNDNPKERTTRYACGFLETYGKWVQRYGYFETRVKLPTAPGLWPTFWLMPDRGAAVGPHQDRQDTANGGMEFDIMEHLDRWGPHRYNIALHWDGYGKQHKALESACNYVEADKDGYIAVGLLWTPGSAIFYGNGKELWRWEDPRVCNVPSGIIIELTTGGWDNNAIDDKQFPADYTIDYVRVWQRRDLASPVDGKQAPAKAN